MTLNYLKMLPWRNWQRARLLILRLVVQAHPEAKVLNKITDQ